MHRLFVAIRPPRLIREHLASHMGGIAGARWQSDEQLHLTLRFIGDVDGRVAQDVDTALLSVRHPPFEIALAGMGAFDRRGEPTALWAGVTPQEPLKALHKKIDHALARAGLDAEKRAYHPHITLARFSRGAPPLPPFPSAAGAVSGPQFAVEDFRLFESTLTPHGAAYSAVARYSLA